jgi:hypothetical protein
LRECRPLVSFFALLLALLLAPTQAQAQEFRLLNRIPTPGAAQRLPPGASVLSTPRPVPASDIEAAVRDIAASWNSTALEPLLAENFYDKSRLVSALAAGVPRDAGLRLVSIQGSQVLSQYTLVGPDGQRAFYSRVSVTVRTQVEYNDLQKGFQRLDGTNDLVLLFKEPAP